MRAVDMKNLNGRTEEKGDKRRREPDCWRWLT